MNKTKIDWADYTINPVKGICKHGCPYCYAIRMYKRFKWNPEIRFDMSVFEGIEKLQAGSKIFVGSTHDIFGDWIPDEWIRRIIQKRINNPQLIFIFLTKNPKRYEHFIFPKNAWIGYSTTFELYYRWTDRQKNNLKFVSIEPIKGFLFPLEEIISYDWIIVGTETGNRKGKGNLNPRWIERIDRDTRLYNIPLFIKDNAGNGRQEYPKI